MKDDSEDSVEIVADDGGIDCVVVKEFCVSFSSFESSPMTVGTSKF